MEINGVIALCCHNATETEHRLPGYYLLTAMECSYHYLFDPWRHFGGSVLGVHSVLLRPMLLPWSAECTRSKLVTPLWQRHCEGECECECECEWVRDPMYLLSALGVWFKWFKKWSPLRLRRNRGGTQAKTNVVTGERITFSISNFL